ncbi:MAG: hypothetical protein AAFP84_07475 [Actinomycetota bacterium]
MTLLTAIEPVDHHHLEDAVRAIEWSASDRMMALGADGRTLVAGAERLTAPVGPDPIACAWISPDRVAVVDGLLGVVVAGRAPTGIVAGSGPVAVASPSRGADDTTACRQHVVIAGHGGVSVMHADAQRIDEPTVIHCGPVRVLAHLGGAIWLAGGTDGLVVVDVALGCVDQRVELPSVVALAAAPAAGRVVAADASGAIHVLDIAELDNGTELTGYPDPVRHLGIDPTGDVIVAAADDELTWWSIDDHGRVADEPETGLGHDAPITSCAVGRAGFVATGDMGGTLRLWSPRMRDLPVAALELDDEITVTTWSHHGDRLAVGTTGGEIVVADIAVGDLL